MTNIFREGLNEAKTVTAEIHNDIDLDNSGQDTMESNSKKVPESIEEEEAPSVFVIVDEQLDNSSDL